MESEDETKRAYYEDQGKEYPTTKRKRYGMSSGARRSQPRKKRQKYNNNTMNMNVSQYGNGIQPSSYAYGQTQYTLYHPYAYQSYAYQHSTVPPPVQLMQQSSADQPPMPEFMGNGIHSSFVHSFVVRAFCVSFYCVCECKDVWLIDRWVY